MCSGSECRRKYRTPKSNDTNDEENGRPYHDHVGFAGRGDEWRQMLNRGGMQLIGQVQLLSETDTAQAPTIAQFNRAVTLPQRTISFGYRLQFKSER